jgi:hypothetical protein
VPLPPFDSVASTLDVQLITNSLWYCCLKSRTWSLSASVLKEGPHDLKLQGTYLQYAIIWALVRWGLNCTTVGSWELIKSKTSLTIFLLLPRSYHKIMEDIINFLMI